MKTLFVMSLLATVGWLAFADQTSFVKAYDADKFDEAAKQIEGLDMTNAGVARRLGVMYYNAKGVDGDKAKGRMLLEQAMIAGDATAAVNLVKIYYKIEDNKPKAAWCLMVAEGLNDESVNDDVAKLRGYLGDDYLKGVASYIALLRDLLSSEQMALKNKTAETDRERTALTKQITSCQEEAKKKDEAFAREREGFESAKDELGKKLAAAEETAVADRKKIEELSAKLAQDILDRSELDKLIVKLKKEHENAAVEAKKAGESLVGYKKIVKTMEVEPMGEDKNVVKLSSKEIFARYNQLVDKYNLLVKKYNKLLRVSQNSVSGSSEQ